MPSTPSPAAAPQFTILLPIVRPPAMLPCAIESVLAQTLPDFELFVVCDGAPDATVACAQAFAARDPRVRCFPFPKGERHGEAHRHAALAHARGAYVAHISDDDLWFPDHLAELEKLLAEADFGHTQPLDVFPGGQIDAKRVDLTDPSVRARLVKFPKANRFGPTFAGYRLSAYRKLAEGWYPGPREIGSDAYMWQKFLCRDDITVGTRAAVTALHFSSPMRANLSMEERGAETRGWLERIRTAEGRAQIAEIVWRSLLRQSVVDENLILSLDGETVPAFAEGENPEHRSVAGKLARLAAAHAQARAEAASAAQEAESLRSENARLSDRLAARERQVTELQAAVTQSQAGIAELQAAVASSHAQAAQLSDDLERAQSDASRAEAARAEAARLARELARMTDSLAQANAAGDVLRGDIARIVGSKSWRWTRPLRSVMGSFISSR